MDAQEPVSIKKAKDGIGESGCWNFALRVKRQQHRLTPVSTVRTKDWTSIFGRYNLKGNISLKCPKRRDIRIFW